jgi:hypothetical protein
MTNHLSDGEILHYRERMISPGELLTADDHLARCAECRTRAFEQMRVPIGDHLVYEQLEEYVDQTAGPLERQKTLAHARICAMCAAELEDLEQFRARMQTPAIGRWRGLSTLWGRPDLAAAAAAIVLAVAVSGWWMLTWHSSQVADVLTAEERRDVQQAVKSGDIPFEQPLAILRGADRALLGPTDIQSAPLHPDPAGEWVRQTTPLLQWSTLTGATRYSVELFDDHLNRVQQSPALQQSQWQIDTALERGRVYLWQVTATFADGRVVSLPRPPAPEARFGVLGSAQESELERIEQASPDSYLVLGALYARAGLLKDAEQELLKIGPTDADFSQSQRLLVTVQRLRVRAGPPGPDAAQH